MYRILSHILLLGSFPAILFGQNGDQPSYQYMYQGPTSQQQPAIMGYGSRSFGTQSTPFLKTASFRDQTAPSDPFNRHTSSVSRPDRFGFMAPTEYGSARGIPPQREVGQTISFSAPSNSETLFVGSNGRFGFGGVDTGRSNGVSSVRMSGDEMSRFESLLPGRSTPYESTRGGAVKGRQAWVPEGTITSSPGDIDDINELTRKLEGLRNELSLRREQRGFKPRTEPGRITSTSQWSMKPPIDGQPDSVWSVESPSTIASSMQRQRITPGKWQPTPPRDPSDPNAMWTVKPPLQPSSNPWARDPYENPSQSVRPLNTGFGDNYVVDERSSFPMTDDRMGEQFSRNRQPTSLGPIRSSNSMFGPSNSFNERLGMPRNDVGTTSVFGGDREPYGQSSQPFRQAPSVNPRRVEPREQFQGGAGGNARYQGQPDNRFSGLNFPRDGPSRPTISDADRQNGQLTWPQSRQEPVDMRGRTFDNEGFQRQPGGLSSVRDSTANGLFSSSPGTNAVSDPQTQGVRTWPPSRTGQMGDLRNAVPPATVNNIGTDLGNNRDALAGLFGGGGNDGLSSSTGRPQSPQAQPNIYPPRAQPAAPAAGSQDIMNGLFGDTPQEPRREPGSKPGQEPGQDERRVLSRAASRYDDVFDENPNNWVKHYEPVEPLPQGVVVPLTFSGGDFYGVVKVGSPEQELTVLFDSGSADMWVLPIEACGQAGPCTTDNNPFYKDRSTTFKTKNPPQELDDTYVSGTTIKGTVAYDTVKIGMGSAQIVVRNQAIGMPNRFANLFENHDAIIGLMMVSPQLIHYKPDPILYQMTKQYGTAPVFGFYVSKNFPQNSKLLFGGGDQTYYTGNFNFHPLVKVPFQDRGMFYNGWNIKLDGFVVLAKQPYTLPMQNSAACIDTGTTTIVGPKETMNQINRAIFSAASFQVTDEYKFPCDAQVMVKSYGELPDIQIVMNGQAYVLWASDYIASTSGGWCYSVFQGDDNADMVIIGRSFMMKYYTRFDQSRKGVEFALANHPAHGNDEIIKLVRSGQKIQVRGS